MAQISISQLPQSGPITGLELVPIVQNGVTVQTTTANLQSSGLYNTITVLGPITASSTTGAISIGTLTYSDTNTFESLQTSVNSYAQLIIQNSSSGSVASADYVVSNNLGTMTTFYGDFGMNSSGYTGVGSYSLPNAVYLSSTSGDLSIGTVTSNSVHFFVNNGATDSMTISASGVTTIASEVLGAGTTTISPLTFTAGTNLSSAAAGAVEYDGIVAYFTPSALNRGVLPAEQWQVLSSSYNLTSQTAAQKLLNATATGAVNLPVGTYQFECAFSLTNLSSTSGSFGFALGGTWVGTQEWMSMADQSANLANASNFQFTFNTAANTGLTTANTQTTGAAFIRGIIRVTTAGTLIPQTSLTTANAAVVGANSYFKISPIGTQTVTSVGNWS